MCGITAIIGNKDCSKNMLDSLKQLQNRGYDSAGISTINDNTFLDCIEFQFDNIAIGIIIIVNNTK